MRRAVRGRRLGSIAGQIVHLTQGDVAVQAIQAFILSFLLEDDGVTAIEYGLIAALIAIVIIVALVATGQSLQGIFTTISNCLQNAAAC